MMEREAFQEIDYRHMFGPMAKWVAQIDDRRPDPRARLARVPRRDVRPPRPGRARAARGHARRGVRRRRRDARTSVIRVHPAPDGRRAGEGAARGRRAAARRRRRRAVERRGARRADGAGAARAALPGRVGLAPPGLRRQHAPTSTSAISTLGADPRLAQRVRDADVLLVIGDRLSEITTAGYTLLDVPDPAQALDPRHRRPRRARPRLRARRSRSPPRPTRSRGRSSALPPLDARGARGRDAPGARRLPRQPPPAARCRATLDMGEVMATVRDAAARGRDLHERRRQLLGLGAPLLRVPRLPDPARADERRDGLRRARRPSPPSCSIPSGSWSRSPATATS